MARLTLHCALVLGPSLAATGEYAQAQCELTKITLESGSSYDGVGEGLALFGNHVLLGAISEDDVLPGAGLVYEFGRFGSMWLAVDNVAPHDLEPDDRFGYRLSVSGPRLLVSSLLDDDHGSGSGSAYVFRTRSGRWAQEAKLIGDSVQGGDRFGSSLDLDGDVAIVGSPYASAAWVFRFDGAQWIEETRLDGVGYDFGAAVAIEGDVAVVGAPDDNTQGAYAGAAYVFERLLDGTWVETAKLLPLQGYPFRSFGGSVAIDGGVIVVGASGSGQAGLPGSAYLFQKDQAGAWYQTAELTDPNAPVSCQIGWSVAIDGDTVIVGARQYHEPNGPSTGGAYVFTRDAVGVWSMAGLLLAEDGDADDWFGNAVAVSGNLAVIGAPRDEPAGPWSGSAYVFAVGPDDDGDGVMDACVCTGDINGDWAVDQSDLGLLVSDYGGVPDNPEADLDGDGLIGQPDLGILLANYGGVCP